jgi:DinB superfamily
MTIEPDGKDWTWVLERPCPECGFDAASLSGPAVAPLVRANAGAWCAVLGQPPDVLRRRPRPDRWSPLEYACHVRDVYELFTRRLHLMLTADQPTFPNWDQDATAEEDDYAAQDPAVVAGQLAEAAEGMATAFESVAGSDWERRGHRSDGATFSVLTFGRYMAHDPVHHLSDVRADLEGTED